MSDESDESDELALLQQAFNLITQWMTSETDGIGTDEDQSEAEAEVPTFWYSSLKSGASRTSVSGAAPKGTPDPDAATSAAIAPAVDHPMGLSPQERRRCLFPSVFQETPQ